MNYLGYNNFDTSALYGLLSGIAIFGLILVLLSLTVSIIYIIGLWKIFKKAGKGGWEALIPFYNQWTLFEISGLNWWWFLFTFAPVVLAFVGAPLLGSVASLFATFNCFYNLSKKFDKELGFAICLTIFTPICIPILGLSKNNVYNPNTSVSKNGVIDDNNVSSYNSHSTEASSSEQDSQTFRFCGNCGTQLDQNTKFCPNCGKQKI